MRLDSAPGHAQRFLAAFGPIRDYFCPRRHRLEATAYRQIRGERFGDWNEVTEIEMAA